MYLQERIFAAHLVWKGKLNFYYLYNIIIPIKREAVWKSGAIPVAVILYPIYVSENF